MQRDARRIPARWDRMDAMSRTDALPRRVRSWAAATLAAAAVLTGTVACGGSEPTATVGAARGAEVYAQSCASCHGSDLRGTAMGPSHLSKVYEVGHHGDASFRRAIEQGSSQHHWCFGPMAAVPGLSEQDITSVIAYVRQEQQSRGIDEGTPRCGG